MIKTVLKIDGVDYSSSVLLGHDWTDNLDDTINTANITLAGLSFQKEFAPSTSATMILEESGEETIINSKTISWVIGSDIVEKKILSSETYYDHHIVLKEPNVIAQQRVCDNMAVTYKLRDVFSPHKGSTAEIPLSSQEYRRERNIAPTQNFHPFKFDIVATGSAYIGHKFEWIMPTWYTLTYADGSVEKPSWDRWNNFNTNILLGDGEESKLIELPLPMLRCSCGVKETKDYQKNGFCTLVVTISRYVTDINNAEIVKSYEVNPALQYPDEVWAEDNIDIPLVSPGDLFSPPYKNVGYIYSSFKWDGVGRTPTLIAITTKVCEQSETASDRLISFTAEKGYNYILSIVSKKYSFPDRRYSATPSLTAYGYINFWGTLVGMGQVEATSYNDNSFCIAAQFSVSSRDLAYTSSSVANALHLFRKAQLTVQPVWKKTNVPILQTPQAFYADNEDELAQTTIIETFYNQKNFYEILYEIGKYIHARPKVEVDGGRYKVGWKRYGSTDKKEDNATKLTVFNSRFIEEYISSVTSYVTNMFQMGGSITEITAPKSEDGSFIAKNDNAIIELQKPIMQIDSVIAKVTHDITINGTSLKAGDTQDITNYVYEQTIYNVLSIKAEEDPNKGMALYFSLGDKVIRGLHYQLPSLNPGEAAADYTIKKILAQVFAIPDSLNVKVNDFNFIVTYRTSDDVRISQSRPDLRKFVNNASLYDNVPLHQQFNNQEDILVDSVAFGRNVYGKLIRTGNSLYERTEWVEHLGDLKESGDLYIINGDWYYVSKVETINLGEYLQSKVEFSNNFNRLSQIIGIPSAPRFSEIAQKNLISRETDISDYVQLGTSAAKKTSGGTCLNNLNWLLKIAFNRGDKSFPPPQYLHICFKSDKDSYEAKNYGWNARIVLPLNVFTCYNTLSFTADCKTNLSAGDQTIETGTATSADAAYRFLNPVKYTDAYGRVDMYDFAIFADTDLSGTESYNPVDDVDGGYRVPEEKSTNVNWAGGVFSSLIDSPYSRMDDNGHGIILLKDNREIFHFNYNVQMVTDSDRFILSQYLWDFGKKQCKIALLKEEVSKLAGSEINKNDVLLGGITYYEYGSTSGQYAAIGVDESVENAILAAIPGDTEEAIAERKTLKNNVAAIIIYSTNATNGASINDYSYFIAARNVSDLSITDKTDPAQYKFADWFLSPASFTKSNS